MFFLKKICEKDEGVEEATEEIPVDINLQEEHCHVDVDKMGTEVEVNLGMSAGIEQIC